MSEKEIIKIWEKEFEIIEKDLEENEQKENYEDIVSYGFDLKTIRTIEELIKIVKQQQEKIEGYEKLVEAINEFKRLKRPVMELVHEMNKFEDEFISKDKIKEKIEKLKDIEQEMNDKQCYWGIGEHQAKVGILEELLKE